jgi:hypothetical protein
MNAFIKSSPGNSEQLRSGCTLVHPDRIIIIGAGSADCVLAFQLSQCLNVQYLLMSDDRRVLERDLGKSLMHSQCFTGEVLGSFRCDCRGQSAPARARQARILEIRYRSLCSSRSQLTNCHGMRAVDCDVTAASSSRPGRTMPSFFIRN